MTSIESILLQILIVVLVALWAEPVVLSAARSGIAAREDQTLHTLPNVTPDAPRANCSLNGKRDLTVPLPPWAMRRSGAEAPG